MDKTKEAMYVQLLDFNSTKRKEWVDNRKPYSALFELTARCNLNCIHCYLQNNHANEQMPFERIIEIIDILHDKGIIFLTFTGGEIFTRTDFLEIYCYAKKKGFLVELFTNGYYVTDEMIETFKMLPPLLIDISIYGANEITYKKVTGVSGAFETVINNCRKLNDANIRIALKSPIIKETLNELSDMQKIASEIDVPFVYTFEICSTIDKNEKPKEFQVKLSEVLKYEFENYFEQIEQGRRHTTTEDSAKIAELTDNRFVYACNVALNSFVIDYLGNLCPCMKLRHKGSKLKPDNYDEIWGKYEVYSKIEASDSYECKGCNARYYCDVCPAEMDLLYGDMEYRPSSICIAAKIRKDFYSGELTFEDAIKKASLYE